MSPRQRRDLRKHVVGILTSCLRTAGSNRRGEITALASRQTRSAKLEMVERHRVLQAAFYPADLGL